MTNGSVEYWEYVSQSPAYEQRYHFSMDSLFAGSNHNPDSGPVWLSARRRLAKPEPEAYRSAEAQFQLDHTHTKIIFIDDNPANIDAAMAFGWDGILFNGRVDLLKEALKNRGVAI
jgi:beta-phosphoglucomutase-like phosphatase (HAD superfamily)